MMKTWSVYGFVEPSSNLIFYVGVTGRPVRHRLSEHIQQAIKGTSEKDCRIRQFVACGMKIPVVILSTFRNEHEARLSERSWISQGILMQWPLLNDEALQHYQKVMQDRFYPQHDEPLQLESEVAHLAHFGATNRRELWPSWLTFGFWKRKKPTVRLIPNNAERTDWS